MKFISKYSPNTWNWDIISRDDMLDWATLASVSYELAARWAAFGAAPRVLDLGCGGGRNTAFFARRGFRASGLDIDDRALKLARVVSHAQNLDIDFKHGDMLNIPYPDNYFDAVYADNILSLTYYDGLKRTLSEIKRVLRPGGEAFIELKKTTCGYATMCRQISSHTYIGPSQYGGHDVVITFITENDIKYLLRDFEIIDTAGPVHGYLPASDQFLILVKKLSQRVK